MKKKETDKQVHPKASRIIALLILLIASSFFTYAQVRMPEIFGDNIILQRGIAIPIWGSSKPGNQITVELDGKRAKTTAGKDGKWKLHLPQMKAGGPYTLSVYEGNTPEPAKAFSNVLIGDIWVASGQSNMEWQVQQSNHATAEIKAANYPTIRVYNIPHAKQISPQDTLAGGSWTSMDSTGVKAASAVAYFFARDLQADLKVPIGIIQSTWGGTPIEAWTSRAQLLTSPSAKSKVLQNDTITASHFIKDSLDLIRFWEIVYQPQNKTELTIPLINYDDASWLEVNMPRTVHGMDISSYQGIVWLRKRISIPPNMEQQDLTIQLGRPEMNYTLYFNGKELAKNIWNASLTHHYTIPASLVKAGENVVTVRMAYLWSGGGFNPPAENMYITDGKAKLSLAGAWKYNKDLEPAIPEIKNYPRYPTYLYNAMINPIVSYGIKGFIWYQGEDNASAPDAYRSLFPLMIKDWRARWKQGNLPFLYVQLANYMKQQAEPSESEWATLREAQTMTLAVPNTGMATIIDIGEADDIHPKNKQEVGRRLALVAKKLVYRQQVQASGPIYKTHKIEGDKIRVSFSETGSGMAAKGGGKLEGFAVAGSDKKFYWADAVINGNTVLLYSEKVKAPVEVRYAWADNPNCNLINKEGLPAIPFRTDNLNNQPGH